VTRVIVAGTGMIPFGKYAEQSLAPMAMAAARNAMSDASVSERDVDAVYFGNAAGGLMTGQEMIRGQAALRKLGLSGQPVFNIENACASGSSAVALGWMAVAAGQFDCVLVVGAEKLLHPDKAMSGRALASGVDQDELAAMRERVGTGANSIFMDLYADKVRTYAQRTGATIEDFAKVAVKSRAYGAANDNAFIRKDTTLAEVLESRLVSPPLTLLMCAPNADGASAIVLRREDHARRASAAQPVFVRSSVVTSGIPDADAVSVVERAAARAYETAAIGPHEVDVVELHDATAPAELWLYEMLGLCGQNAGPELIRAGATGPAGRIAVNPSGGMLCRGHPVGASGVAQICELADQLRGRSGKRQKPGARVGLAENSGGRVGRDSAAASVTIVSL
jgi:acetyl-CoA acetyltransferase